MLLVGMEAVYNDSCENGPFGLLPAQLCYRLGFLWVSALDCAGNNSFRIGNCADKPRSRPSLACTSQIVVRLAEHI